MSQTAAHALADAAERLAVPVSPARPAGQTRAIAAYRAMPEHEQADHHRIAEKVRGFILALGWVVTDTQGLEDFICDALNDHTDCNSRVVHAILRGVL